MNRVVFQQLLIETHLRMIDLTNTKGSEYSGDGDDQLRNFHEAGADADIKPEQAWLVHFNKHVAAIKSYVRTGIVKSEPIEGRIDDAILYLVLLKALVRDRAVQKQHIAVDAPTPAREDE